MDELTQAFLETLQRTQTMPAERMLIYQRSLIERLVRHARVQVPFYRDSGRLDVLFTADDRIDWNRWNEVPILTRAEAQAHSEALYAETVPADCGDVTDGATSGSTGRPLKFRVNRLMAAAGTALLERGLIWAGLAPPATIAWIRYDYADSARYPTGAVYSSVVRGVPRLLHTLSVATAVEDQAKWLARIKPDVVMGYPNALALVGQAVPSGLDHLFRLVVCNGEVTTDHARLAIEQTFRCKTMDVYSSSEMGTIAVEDAQIGQTFLCEETAYVEQREGAASAGAGLAELVVTPFYNYAMPLIRYVTGDYAAFDRSAPPDARTLRRLGVIAGRERNLFVLPSGKHWWPYSLTTKRIAEYLVFDQIQFVQTHRDRIELRYVSNAAEPLKNAAELLAGLRATTPEPMEFIIQRVPQIPRHASGKFEEYLCELDTQTA